MAYNSQFLRMTWRFFVASTDEIGETNLNFVSGTPWTGAAAALAEVDAADLEDFGDALATLMTTTGLNWADYSSLQTVKLAAIGTDGSYVPGADPVEFIDPSPAVGTAANTLPQDTVVVSTRTVTDVGPGVKGRMYLPHTRMTLPAGFAITSSTTRDAIAAASATFVDACNTFLNALVTPTVAAAIMSQVGSGTAKEITRVRVGGVTDTQRRRRNAIPELYSESNV